MDEDIEEEKDKTKEPELVSSENRRSVYDVSDFKELVVEVKLNGDSYLDVQDKSGTVIETFAGLEEGESVELDYSDRDYVKINIGNSTVVTVRLNGEVIEYPTGSVHQYLILDRNAQ
nr:DUF4115 domain-containing protein [Bacillus piscicola]